MLFLHFIHFVVKNLPAFNFSNDHTSLGSRRRKAPSKTCRKLQEIQVCKTVSRIIAYAPLFSDFLFRSRFRIQLLSSASAFSQLPFSSIRFGFALLGPLCTVDSAFSSNLFPTAEAFSSTSLRRFFQFLCFFFAPSSFKLPFRVLAHSPCVIMQSLHHHTYRYYRFLDFSS